MREGPTLSSNKSCKSYFLVGKDKVYFNGDFDSGNLQKVQQLSMFAYRIIPGYDMRTQSTRKTFFHFQVFGFRNCSVKFHIARCFLLENLLKTNRTNDYYHPVVRTAPEGLFGRIHSKTEIYYNNNDEPQLTFTHQFSHSQWAEFAFTYPYSYSDCQNFLKEVEDKYSLHSSIYFHREVLVTTPQKRNLDIITITDIDNCKQQRQPLIPGIQSNQPRPFKISKPKVLVSARVHPGEAPSSYCMEGVMKFLLNERDFRSAVLRKYFHFILIPMINPDGVYEGMFRTDLNGDNLNRFYKYCDKEKQCTIWSITQYLNSLNTVDFFFDLHAHPSHKDFFIYGNAFDEFTHQVEAQLFGKLVEFNCPYFENLDSIFTERAMKAKDKFDNFNKEGCARVFYHKKFKLIHSYTVECGYYRPNKLNKIQKYICPNIPSRYCYTSDWQEASEGEYQPESYMLLGKSLMISVLDLFQINPYSRLGLCQFQMINALRRTIAQRIFSQCEKFRLRQKLSFKKISKITFLINQSYYKSRFENTALSVLQLTSSQKNSLLSIHNNTPRDRSPINLNPELQSLQLHILSQSSLPLSPARQKNFIDSLQSQSKAEDLNVHQQLLCSFSKYNKTQANSQKEIKSTIKIRKIKTMEINTVDLRKSLKGFHIKTEQDQSERKRKLETQVLQKLIQTKLGGNKNSVIAISKKNLSKYRWNQESSRRLVSKSRLPALSISKQGVSSAVKKVKTES